MHLKFCDCNSLTALYGDEEVFVRPWLFVQFLIRSLRNITTLAKICLRYDDRIDSKILLIALSTYANKLSEFLEEYFEIPKSKITQEANLYTDLDLDSIDAVDLIVKLQEITGKKIAPAEFKEVRSVGDVVDKVYEMVNQ